MRRLRALLRDARTRAAERAVVVEGPRALAAALDRGARLEVLFCAPGAHRAFAPLVSRAAAAAVPVRGLKEGVLERVGSTVTPQPILGVAEMPSHDRSVLQRDGLVVMAVELADPGNLGTIVRGAEASGAAAIVLGPASVDAYNPKVVRASAGAIFGMPVLQCESEGWSAVEALDALGELGRRRLGAQARSATPYDQVDFRQPTAVVLGNEARGLSDEIGEHLDGSVSIPMRPPAESLNVAMAATVLCYESARQQLPGTS